MRYNKRAWKKNAWSLWAWRGQPKSKRRSRECRKQLTRLNESIRKNFDLDLFSNLCNKFICEGPLNTMGYHAIDAAQYSWKMLK